jgi:hypothetical protein
MDDAMRRQAADEVVVLLAASAETKSDTIKKKYSKRITALSKQYGVQLSDIPWDFEAWMAYSL